MYAPQNAAVFSEGTHPVGEGACRIYNIFAYRLQAATVIFEGAPVENKGE